MAHRREAVRQHFLDADGAKAASWGVVGDRGRGRAVVENALSDSRGLEMVLHANLAEQFLRDRPAAPADRQD